MRKYVYLLHDHQIFEDTLYWIPQIQYITSWSLRKGFNVIPTTNAHCCDRFVLVVVIHVITAVLVFSFPRSTTISSPAPDSSESPIAASSTPPPTVPLHFPSYSFSSHNAVCRSRGPGEHGWCDPFRGWWCWTWGEEWGSLSSPVPFHSCLLPLGRKRAQCLWHVPSLLSDVVKIILMKKITNGMKHQMTSESLCFLSDVDKKKLRKLKLSTNIETDTPCTPEST